MNAHHAECLAKKASHPSCLILRDSTYQVSLLLKCRNWEHSELCEVRVTQRLHRDLVWDRQLTFLSRWKKRWDHLWTLQLVHYYFLFQARWRLMRSSGYQNDVMGRFDCKFASWAMSESLNLKAFVGHLDPGASRMHQEHVNTVHR